MRTVASQLGSQFVRLFVFMTRRLRAPCLFLSLPKLFLLCLCLSPLAVSAASDPFSEAQFISGLGANELALEKIEQQQSRPEISDDIWLRWERLRIELYSKTEAWKTLIQRINTQQQAIPPVASDWFATQQVAAWLALGDGHSARKVLMKVIWLRDTQPVSVNLNIWRKQLIRSYLLDDQANAAHTSMLRHAQDYQAVEGAQFLRAKVLLQAGRANDAEDILRKDKSIQAKSLYLLAALRSEKLSATKVIAKAKRIIKSKGLDKNIRLRLWSIIAEASRSKNLTGQYANALEKIFIETRATQIDDGLIKLNAELLWKAYNEHAQAIGNRKHLLIGDDKKWFKLAKSIKKNPLRQRTLYGFLTESGSNQTSKTQAHEGIVKSLQGSKAGMEILRRLYLNASRYDNVDKLPAIVRYTLLVQALNESNISLASKLMHGLKVAPQGVEPLAWDMRRARVFVMAGEVSRGSEILKSVLEGDEALDKTAIDRFMQVLFDLQTLDEHESAYNLFEQLLKQTGGFQLRREILFWMADSRKAQKQFAEAAVLYLRSADVVGEALPDLWAQSAYYQAAEMMTEANLISDAKRIYSQLLRVSKDQARRAVLQRRLQQLWLHNEKAAKVAN